MPVQVPNWEPGEWERGVNAQAQNYPLVHTFTPNDGGESYSPERLGSFEATEEVPGGYVSAAGRISFAEFQSNREVLRYGTTWEVRLKHNNRLIWAGRLIDPEANSDDTVTLAAKGWATLADRAVERILYMSADLSEWHTADEDPFNYKRADKYTKLQGDTWSLVTGTGAVDGDGFRLDDVNAVVKKNLTGLTAAVPAEVLFTGKLNAGSEAHVKIQVYNETDSNVVKEHRKKITSTNPDDIGMIPFTPVGGKTYSARVKYIKGPNKPIVSYAKFGETPNVTSEKIEAEVRGKQLRFTVRRGTRFHGGEGTALIRWVPDNDLRAIGFDYNKTHSNNNFELQLLATTGPSGAFTVIQSWDCGASGPANGAELYQRVRGGDYDQLAFRFKRKNDKPEKNHKKFEVWVTNVRVYGVALDDDFSTSDVARDVGKRLGLVTRRIDDNATVAVPLDAQEGTFADILNEAAVLGDDRWAIYNEKPTLWFGPWAERGVFKPVEEFGTFDLIPLDRYTSVRVPYRGKGGVRQWVTVHSERDILREGPENVYDVQLDDPLPPKDIAKALAAKIIDYLSKKRWGGSAQLFEVIHEAEDKILSAHHLRAGDVLEYKGHRLRIRAIRRTEHGVDLEFDDGMALLDRILAKRARLLALGRGAADATLRSLHTQEPREPETVTLNIQVREQKTNANYRAKVTWPHVEEDVGGIPADVVKYQAQLRPVIAGSVGDNDWQDPNDSSYWKKPSEGEVETILRRYKKDGDSSHDDGLTAVFHDLDRPKRWSYQARVRAVDESSRESEWTEWTSPQLPSAVADPEPPAPGGLQITWDRQEKDRHGPQFKGTLQWNEVTWDMPGGSDNDDVNEYEIAFAKWSKVDHTITGKVGESKKWTVKRREADGDTINKATVRNISKRYGYRFKVRSIDRFGRVGDFSNWFPAVGSSPSIPNDTTPPPAPAWESNGFRVKRRKFICEWDAANDPDNSDEIHPDIAYFQVEVATDAGFTNVIRKDRYHLGTRKVFDARPTQATYHARVRSVDGSNNKSAWVTTSDTRKKPGKVTNKSVDPDTKAVRVTWDPPTAWHDATTTEWDTSEVAYYKVEVSNNNFATPGDPATYKMDPHVLSTARRFKVPADSGTWKARITAIGHDLVDDGFEETAGGATPETSVSDGAVPAAVASAPLLGPAIGSFNVQWTGVTNADPTSYEIHLSTSPGFTPGAATRVTTVAGSNTGTAMAFVINKDASGAALIYASTYYCRILARDIDGPAAAYSPESTGQSPLRAAAGDITNVGGNQVRDFTPPASSPTPTVTGGPTYLYVRWTPVTNNDPVLYEIHISTTTGFTPSGSTKVAEMDNSTSLIISKMPDGSGLVYGTTYYIKTVARDLDGSAAASAQASATMVKIQTVDVNSGAITANEIAANTITAGQIAANTITANEIAAMQISAISADLGTITAGSITGATITGGTFRTESSGQRLEMTSANRDRIRFFDTTAEQGYIQVNTGVLTLLAQSGVYWEFKGANKPRWESEIIATQTWVASQGYASGGHGHSGGSHQHSVTAGGGHTHTTSGAPSNHGHQGRTNPENGGATINTAHYHTIENVTDTGRVSDNPGTHDHGGLVGSQTHSH